MLLSQVELREVETDTSWHVEKTFPKALSTGSQSFQITGFVVPYEAQGEMETFLLVDDPLSCPFCGTGESYGPVLEVWLKRAVDNIPEFSLITVVGELELITDPMTMQLYRLVNARVKPAA